jgi:thiamine kinase-like enzyme
VGDTTRLFAPDRLAPAPPAVAGGAIPRQELLAHPAVQAWRRLAPDGPLPSRIAPARLKPYERKTAVYRLDDVAPGGGAVIAKRCKRADGTIERIVYEEYLPRLPIPAAGYLGCTDDPGEAATWLFTREVNGERYAHHDPEHRVYAARWLGLLHSGAQAIGRHPALPAADPRRYLEHLRRARECIRTNCHNPILTGEDVAFLESVRSRLDELEEHWDRLEEVCAHVPHTLVHGDFNGKNLRVRSAGADPGIVVFDWEDAGWGPPAVDLAQLALPASRLSAGPDFDTYWQVVSARRPEYDRADFERLAYCGTVFRVLAVLDWESRNLAFEWAQWHIGSIRLYEVELAHALHGLNTARGTRAPFEVARI